MNIELQDIIILLVIGTVVFLQIKYFRQNRNKILKYRQSIDEVNTLELKKKSIYDSISERANIETSINEYENSGNHEVMKSIEDLSIDRGESDIPNF